MMAKVALNLPEMDVVTINADWTYVFHTHRCGKVNAAEIAQCCGERLARIKMPRYAMFKEVLLHSATHCVAKHNFKAGTSFLVRAANFT